MSTRVTKQKRISTNHLRKRPHMLPPLSALHEKSAGPIDPLQPPNILALEAGNSRLGSPTPRWHRPTPEELQLFHESPSEGRPSIRLTTYDEDVAPVTDKKRDSLMIMDLKNDPLYKSDHEVHDRRGAHKSKKLLLNDDFTKQLAISDEKQDLDFEKRKIGGRSQLSEKAHLPSRYAPLKPIVKRKTDEHTET